MATKRNKKVLLKYIVVVPHDYGTSDDMYVENFGTKKKLESWLESKLSEDDEFSLLNIEIYEIKNEIRAKAKSTVSLSVKLENVE